MPPEPLAFFQTSTARLAGLSSDWRAVLPRLAGVWAVLLVLFLPDWANMAAQWWNSSTYNHVLLIPAIVGWLVWQRAGALVQLRPTAWWPGLVLAGGALLLWLLGALAGVATARQLGLVLLLIAATVTLIGPRASTAVAFPMGYLLFLVPFGDELVPLLQTITAKITIALVHLSGISAEIDGVFIDTPAGLFEVAEACSGVKFLIAMIAFGVLVANLCFTSWRRRALFLAACVLVPILANGVRAWGTIYAAQYFGVEAAAGFDHIVYGWFFFAIVIALLLGGAWRYFDRPVDAPPVDLDRIAASALLDRLETRRIGGLAALGALAVLVAAGQGWAYAATRLAADLPRQITLPEVPGWHMVDYQPMVPWEPRALGANHRLLGRYADDRGHTVDVFMAVYAAQVEGREAGGYGQGALPPDSAWSWQSNGPPAADAISDRLLAQGSITRLAQTTYRTGTLSTGSNLRLKIAGLKDRLLLRSAPTSVLILSAEERPRAPGAAAALARFRRAAGPLDQWMDRTAGLR